MPKISHADRLENAEIIAEFPDVSVDDFVRWCRVTGNYQGCQAFDNYTAYAMAREAKRAALEVVQGMNGRVGTEA